MATTDVDIAVAVGADVDSDAVAVNDTVMNCQLTDSGCILTFLHSSIPSAAHPSVHPSLPSYPACLLGYPDNPDNPGNPDWSWPCWCCIDMQLTEPRDGFRPGMGQLTQWDLFYSRMHFLWLNDSWSCFLFKCCDSSKETLSPLHNNWTIGSCNWGNDPEKSQHPPCDRLTAEIYSYCMYTLNI